jgi:hypothetical protein
MIRAYPGVECKKIRKINAVSIYAIVVVQG